ncbi:MAG: hypothetical protein ACRDRW_02630 [Pseudonocardiaceae bacterium]
MITGPAENGVLETFGRARPLTFDTASVEITHEALLRAWPRLADWISATVGQLNSIPMQPAQRQRTAQTVHIATAPTALDHIGAAE